MRWFGEKEKAAGKVSNLEEISKKKAEEKKERDAI